MCAPSCFDMLDQAEQTKLEADAERKKLAADAVREVMTMLKRICPYHNIKLAEVTAALVLRSAHWLPC